VSGFLIHIRPLCILPCGDDTLNCAVRAPEKGIIIASIMAIIMQARILLFEFVMHMLFTAFKAIKCKWIYVLILKDAVTAVIDALIKIYN
jgi:hypothetical protein